MNTPPTKILNDAELAAAVEKIIRELELEEDVLPSEASSGSTPVDNRNYVDEHTGSELSTLSGDGSQRDPTLPQFRPNSNDHIAKMAPKRMRMGGDSGDEHEPEILTKFRAMKISISTTGYTTNAPASNTTTTITASIEQFQPQESQDVNIIASQTASADHLQQQEAPGADNQDNKKPKKPMKKRGGKKIAERRLQEFMAQVEPGKEGAGPRKPFEVRESPGKGEGLFALIHLPVGATILDEHPLLWPDDSQNAASILSAYQALSSEDKTRLLALPSWPNRQSTIQAQKWRSEIGRTPSPEEMQVLRTFYSNICLRGVHPEAAKLNHSCQPNISPSWNMATQKLSLQVIRQIKEGEELTVSYLESPERTPIAVRASYLHSLNISCSCPACDKTAPGFKEQEMRRQQMKRMYEMVVSSSIVEGMEYSRAQYETVLSLALETISLYEQDGVCSPDLSLLYEKAKLCNVGLGNYEEALTFSEKECKTDAGWAGPNHPITQESNGFRVSYRAGKLVGLRSGMAMDPSYGVGGEAPGAVEGDDDNGVDGVAGEKEGM